MEVRRFIEPTAAPQWREPVLVVCPRCGEQAVVRSSEQEMTRLVCSACALTKNWAPERLFVLVDGRRVTLRRDHGAWMDERTGKYVRHYEHEEGTEPRFGAPLWLRTTCCGGHLLWANNAAHLEYLEGYIGADLRVRSSGPAPLSSRLPTWMKSSQNRGDVLHALAELRARLA